MENYYRIYFLFCQGRYYIINIIKNIKNTPEDFLPGYSIASNYILITWRVPDPLPIAGFVHATYYWRAGSWCHQGWSACRWWSLFLKKDCN